MTLRNMHTMLPHLAYPPRFHPREPLPRGFTTHAPPLSATCTRALVTAAAYKARLKPASRMVVALDQFIGPQADSWKGKGVDLPSYSTNKRTRLAGSLYLEYYTEEPVDRFVVGVF